MTTWTQVMTQVRLLDEQRSREGQIREGEAEQLVTMLLDFHRKAVAPTLSEPPSKTAPAPRRSPSTR